MSVRRTTAAWVAATVASATAVLALLPYVANAAERQEVTFGAIFFFPGPSVIQPTVTELNDKVVRVEGVRYFGVGSAESLGDEAGAHLSWIVNREQMRGTVSGTVNMSRSLTGLVWQGALRGRVTPEGAEGVLHLSEVSTGQRFSGSWESHGFVDPASNPHSLAIVVTGTLTSD